MTPNPALQRKYDVRGIYPTEVNPEVHQALGRAFAAVVKPKTVVVGMDVRASGPELKAALIEGLRKSGVNVIDVGTISTEMLYFAVVKLKCDGGVIVSASHNPAEYNGAKFILAGAKVLSPEGDFMKVKELAAANKFEDAPTYGTLETQDVMDAYLDHCLGVVDMTQLKPLRIVLNPNFGAVCLVYKHLQQRLPFEVIPLNGEVDGTFPKGRPDPLREETRQETIDLIKKTKPDFGVAWDADGDRVFFYDENGDFIDGYYAMTILAQYFLQKTAGAKIIHEPRQIWAMDDVIQRYMGVDVLSRAGHVYLKEKMQEVDGLFGGEMSGHLYFKDYFYCDCGLIPFLIMWQLVSEGQKLSTLAAPFRDKYFISGEINFTVPDTAKVMKYMQEVGKAEHRPEYGDLELSEDHQWRANLRPSDNEPLFRLNVEAISQELVDQKVAELSKMIEQASK